MSEGSGATPETVSVEDRAPTGHSKSYTGKDGARQSARWCKPPRVSGQRRCERILHRPHQGLFRPEAVDSVKQTLTRIQQSRNNYIGLDYGINEGNLNVLSVLFSYGHMKKVFSFVIYF